MNRNADKYFVNYSGKNSFVAGKNMESESKNTILCGVVVTYAQLRKHPPEAGSLDRVIW